MNEIIEQMENDNNILAESLLIDLGLSNYDASVIIDESISPAKFTVLVFNDDRYIKEINEFKGRPITYIYGDRPRPLNNC